MTDERDDLLKEFGLLDDEETQVDDDEIQAAPAKTMSIPGRPKFRRGNRQREAFTRFIAALKDAPPPSDEPISRYVDTRREV